MKKRKSAGEVTFMKREDGCWSWTAWSGNGAAMGASDIPITSPTLAHARRQLDRLIEIALSVKRVAVKPGKVWTVRNAP